MAARLRFWALAHAHALLAGAIILLAAAVRVALAAGGWPGTDSDEATMGVMAKHILTNGEHPIFFYGQAYMGTIEAYLGAGMYAIFGVSLFALKLGLIVLYAVFMVIMYGLLSALFERRWALAGLLLLAFGSDAMLYHELSAWGGYLETLCFGALVTLIAVWLADTRGATNSAGQACEGNGIARGNGSVPQAREGNEIVHSEPLRAVVGGRGRAVGFAGWGLAAGLAIWSDPLVAPFVGMSALLLVVRCRAELRRGLGAVAIAGLLLGVSPWLVYIATAPTPAAASFLQNAPTKQTTSSPGVPALSLGMTVVEHVLGTLVIAIPNNSGANVFCPALTATTAWPPTQWTPAGVQACIVVRGLWGTGFVALLLLALSLNGRAFWALWRARAHEPTESTETVPHQRLAILGGRLCTLIGCGATILFFTISSSSSFAPWQYSRYLISILIALPVMLATLSEPRPTPIRAGGFRGPQLQAAPKEATTRSGAAADLASSEAPQTRFQPPVVRWPVVIAALYTLIFALATLATFTEIPNQQRQNAQHTALITTLEQQGDTRIYSDYWNCMWLVFLSDERIICATLAVHDGQLVVTENRYAPYVRMVARAPDPAYVFPVGSIQATTFVTLATQAGWQITQSTFDNQYVIYHRVLPTAQLIIGADGGGGHRDPSAHR